MKIICLVENQTSNKDLKSEHGLSFYIEFGKRKILFDLGQGHLFIENAIQIGLDLSQVDTVIISHGHYDHAGGLKDFLKINSHAKIYMHKDAFRHHYSIDIQSELNEIGVDPTLKAHSQIKLTDSFLEIDSNIKLFSKLNQNRFYPSGNRLLKQSIGNDIFADDFSHEQNMILVQGNHYVLFAGCAHKGILNIVTQAIDIMGAEPSHVFGGFHLHSRSTDVSENDDFILSLGAELCKFNTLYHTGHCTGNYAFQLLNKHFNPQIQRFSTGSTFEI